MAGKIVVVAVQMHAKEGDVEGNVKRMLNVGMRAAETLGRVDLMVYPELALTGLGSTSASHAVPAEGRHSEVMVRMAEEIGAHVVYGFLERALGHIHNSAAVVGPGGLVGVYRKVHLWGDEALRADPGDCYPVFRLPWGKLGCLVCYDLNFPEAARSLALEGAQVIALPAAWDWPYLEGWELCLRARAYDNLVYLVAAGQWGSSAGGRLLGHSRVVAPDGRFLAWLGDTGDGWCAAEVDLGARRALEARGHRFLIDRRPNTYGSLTAGMAGDGQ